MEENRQENTEIVSKETSEMTDEALFDKKKKPSKQQKNYIPAIIIACAAIVLVLAAAAYFIITGMQKKAAEAAAQAEEEERVKMELAIAQNEEYDSIVNSSVFLDGVTVNGVSIAGLTMEEAQKLLEESFGSSKMEGSLTLHLNAETDDESSTSAQNTTATDAAAEETTEETEDTTEEQTEETTEEPTEDAEAADAASDETTVQAAPVKDANGNYSFDLSAVGVSSNITDVLTEAFKLARTGTQESVLQEAADIKENGRDFELSVTYDFSGVAAAVDTLADAIDRPVENEKIGELDLENHTVSMVPGQDGITVDRTALTTAIEDAVSNGNTDETIEIPYESIPVDDTKQTELIYTTMTTSFKGSSSNRIYNITKGAGLINGTVLKPGETFSTNDTLGQRTTKNGWKMAHAYVNGTTEEQAGGGVCQLSSTLYNAVVMADLEIVHRQNHSMKVSYVSQGLDATINSVGNMIDFKFKNDTDSDVVIFAWISGKTVTMKVYRCAFDTEKHGFDFDEIRLTSEKTSTLSPKGDWDITVDASKPAGYEEITQERKNGSVWQSYKHYYLNGVEVHSEKLDTSTYKAYPGAKIVGPEAEATATPKPDTTSEATPTPSPTPKQEESEPTPKSDDSDTSTNTDTTDAQ